MLPSVAIMVLEERLMKFLYLFLYKALPVSLPHSLLSTFSLYLWFCVDWVWHSSRLDCLPCTSWICGVDDFVKCLLFFLNHSSFSLWFSCNVCTFIKLPGTLCSIFLEFTFAFLSVWKVSVGKCLNLLILFLEHVNLTDGSVKIIFHCYFSISFFWHFGFYLRIIISLLILPICYYILYFIRWHNTHSF